MSVGVDDGDAERERHIAVRVARSLRPDPGTFAVGPRPGSLPDVFAGRPWLYTRRVCQFCGQATVRHLTLVAKKALVSAVPVRRVDGYEFRDRLPAGGPGRAAILTGCGRTANL